MLRGDIRIELRHFRIDRIEPVLLHAQRIEIAPSQIRSPAGRFDIAADAVLILRDLPAFARELFLADAGGVDVGDQAPELCQRIL